MAHALKRHRRRYFTCESVGHHRAGLKLAKKIDSSDRELFRLLLMKSTGCVSDQRCLETGNRVMCTSVRRTFSRRPVLFKCLPGRECFVLAKSKFDPPSIGSFEIVERLVPVASRLDLPIEASRMRSTCHVPNLMASFAESELRAKYLCLFSNLLMGLALQAQGAVKAERSSVGAGSVMCTMGPYIPGKFSGVRHGLSPSLLKWESGRSGHVRLFVGWCEARTTSVTP
ncbi:LOW QUALITY PROTEIN: hypothetical protein OSB04_027514 [Centaurea solstitialis]|uniref:Tf2-1-like SH3-like domain-containing protein n=1 Tax=Centaurea solstitialis TaxID=347529 RepID=A0AA38SLE3_9ASTR|nr:LOW QUALITY PROTEIN: hypothetical protein OSB04_027514 [Centaurea solstitialis]